MTHKPQFFTNQLLVAMPQLDDPYFDHTVTLLCEHNEEGAMGVTINQPLDVRLYDMFQELELPAAASHLDAPLHFGGPVQTEHGFVLHDGPAIWESSLQIVENLHLTASRDVLDAIATGGGPDHFRVMLGYAGWAAGQLEEELSDNTWLIAPAGSEIVFDTPAQQQWERAANQLGVDFGLLSTTAGHA